MLISIYYLYLLLSVLIKRFSLNFQVEDGFGRNGRIWYLKLNILLIAQMVMHLSCNRDFKLEGVRYRHRGSKCTPATEF